MAPDKKGNWVQCGILPIGGGHAVAKPQLRLERDREVNKFWARIADRCDYCLRMQDPKGWRSMIHDVLDYGQSDYLRP